MYSKSNRIYVSTLRAVHLFPFLIICLLDKLSGGASAFSMGMSSGRTIYGVPNSGWTSPQWNWGYAVGTGHDCAAICRQRYNSPQARSALIKDLCDSPTMSIENRREPKNFEEVKLVLALAWQRGRWDGSDGGIGGYRDVLAAMADGRRYETGDEEENATRLVNDMSERFHLLGPTKEQLDEMERVLRILEKDTDSARRKCSGMVLEAMDFVKNGL